MWLKRQQLIEEYGCSENKVRQIEELAYRAQKMRETKHNSSSLMHFLDFEDVEDFSNPPPGAFEEYCPKEEIKNSPASDTDD